MRKDLTELVFIIDRSGSMSGLERDTIGGFNSMIRKQKQAEGEALISTVLFDNVSEVLHDRVNVKDIQPTRLYGTRNNSFIRCNWRSNLSYWKCPQVCTPRRCTRAHHVCNHDRWNGECQPVLQ